MRIVRDFWRESVGAAGADDTGPEAPVVVAFRKAWSDVQKGSDANTAAAAAVKSSDEWARVQRDTARSIFKDVAGRDATEAETAEIASHEDTDAMARRAIELVERDRPSTSEPSQGAGLAESASPAVDANNVAEPVGVDEDWMAEFAAAFGRDPYVHEYVLVRPMEEPLRSLRKRHADAFEKLRRVHAQYLDDGLDEQAFVKQYVPKIYHDDSVAENVRAEALRRPEYRHAMETRLSSLHLVSCGRDLTQQESAYLFDTTVFEKELPLDTDELNDLVARFVDQGEKIRTRIAHLVDVYLRRDADSDEVEEWVHPFRTDDGAESRLRAELIASHEFHSVAAEAIKSLDASKRPRDVFRILDAALGRSELRSIESRYDLDETLQKFTSSQ